MEVLDDLNLNGLKIIQDNNYFKFGIDSVLLSDFSKIRKDKTVVDFGTGNGIIPLLLYGKYKGITIKGIELVKELYELALRNVVMNGLSGSIEIINGDIKDAVKIFGKGRIDYVVSNPPYIKSDGLLNDNEFQRIARHELACTVSDIVEQAHGILSESGTLYMIHRSNRLADVLCEMRAGKIEPKIVRFISKNAVTPPGLFLVKGIKNAKSDLVIQKPLYIYDMDNKYTEEIEVIYGKR
jgi:tRNA1Val (adenine37-N6)-methyltransferase